MFRWQEIFLSAAALLLCMAAVANPASAVVEFDRATRLAMEEDYEGALREYEAFLVHAPDDQLAPVATTAIANIHLEARHDTMAALAVLDRILTNHRATPWAPEAARQKGACAAAQERWTTAAEAYRLAADLAVGQTDGPSDDWINRTTQAAADCFYQAGQPQQVIEIYERILEKSPPHEVAATALYRLGESYESSEDTVKAAQNFAALVERYPSSPMFDRALLKRELIDAHLTLDWHPYELYAAGTGLIRANDFPAALTNCNELLAGEMSASLRQCTEYRRITLETVTAGDFAAGCSRLQEYIDANPGGLRTDRAELTLAQNWMPVADLERLASDNPEDAATHARLGEMYVRVGSSARAIETLERAAKLDPETDRPQLMLGYALTAAGRTEEAHAAFLTYLERNPDDTNSMNAIGYNLLGRGEAEEAIRYFERYAATAPEEANAHDSLAEGYLTVGRLEDAAAEYEKAVAIDAGFANSHFMLGRVYQQLEQPDKAIAAYERFLELNPVGPQADESRTALGELGAR